MKREQDSRVSGASGQEHKATVLRILVQEELHPITELTTAVALGEAFRGIFACYRWSYERPQIMHRDINLTNLMYRRIEGKVFGVLNDFGLSIVMSGDSSTVPQRVGTAPYDPRPPLPWPPSTSSPPVRPRIALPRHGHCIVLLPRRPGDRDPAIRGVGGARDGCSTDQEETLLRKPRSPTPANLIDLYAVNRALKKLFRDGFHARIDATFDGLDPTFDNDTLGGHVTFDTFERILDEHLPWSIREFVFPVCPVDDSSFSPGIV
ncbi:hypothetical protein C8R45DRAFT_400137 [Mycena sanguinolenta]|nr:hypothetical protein C8R45DRAFT_400137 [Mycena sanguinolenta]